jgi:hypothetical protein
MEESLFQKEKRLKSRKQVYKETYRKGLFFEYNQKDKLIEWIKQNDVIIRVHSGGQLNDETEFVSITIEGFKP